MCKRAATFVLFFFFFSPPNQPLVSHHGFLSFLSGPCTVKASHLGKLSTTPVSLPLLLLRLYFADACVSARDCNHVRVALARMSCLLDDTAAVKGADILRYIFHRKVHIQISVPFCYDPMTETNAVMAVTSGDQGDSDIISELSGFSFPFPCLYHIFSL